MTLFAKTTCLRSTRWPLVRFGIGALVVASLLFSFWRGSAIAQEATAKPATPPAANAVGGKHPTGPIQYVGPDTYILLDAQGRPQPVPGMTYEDFLAAWKKLNQAAAPDGQPRYTIENIKIDGQTHGQRAELKCDVTIHLLVDGAIEIPLGLVGAILHGDPQFSDVQATPPNVRENATPSTAKSADKYVDFDSQRGGFVARTTGAAGERQRLSLNLIVPLLRDGAETTLPLNFPRSTSSSLALTVDTPFSDARATSGVVTSKRSTTDGSTRIDVAGPSGQFRLIWQVSNNDKAAVTSVLNAVGAIHVTIDGRGVRSDAHLTVRSFGGAFDQFRVRLPSGAKLIRDPTTAGSQEQKYRVTEEPQAASTANAPNNAGQIVLIELKEKQQGPVVVDLSTEQPGHDASQSVEVAGFEVIGAVRQYGDIALNVASDWQARWKIGRDVRQVDPNELDSSLQRTDLTAAFQYDRQPWSLGVRVSPRQSRVHVTPQYDLELLPEEARLNVRLAYQNFGARAFAFRIEIGGWERSGESVESGGLVDQDRIDVSPEGVLTLPLSQASSRKAEVAFSLRHPLKRDAPGIQLSLPVPLADSVATGELTVRAPAEVELIPDIIHSTGLAASPTRDVTREPNADAPSELHFRTLLPGAVFAATRMNRDRDESATIHAQMNIAADSMQVDERIDYVVRYEPIKELVFEVPSDFSLDDASTEISLVVADGESDNSEQRTPLVIEAIPDENDTEVTEVHRLRATLPQPRIGKFTVAARYQIPRAQASSTLSALQVPLFSPVEARITAQQATVRAPKGVLVSPGANADSSSWKSFVPQHKPDAAAINYEFSTDRSEPMLPLIISAADQNSPSTTVVERVWLQTWLSGGLEQDRAAFRLRTSNAQATVELPPDAPAGEVEVLVDGQPADVVSRAAGRIAVRLFKESQTAADAGSEPSIHTLEVRFRRPIQQSLISRHRVTPPQIDATTELSQVYWQIVLPADEHVVQSPVNLVSASQWQWLGAFWGRQPKMSQVELEKWAGALPQIAPATTDSQYLFTGLLPVSSVAFVTAPRWFIVLTASTLAVVLLAGWYYVPVRIRPWLLIGVIVAVAASAISFPTAALLIAQAAVIGVVLAPVSIFLSRLWARPTRPTLTSSITPSSQRVVTPRSDVVVMPSVIAAASTAPTVTLRTSDSER